MLALASPRTYTTLAGNLEAQSAQNSMALGDTNTGPALRKQASVCGVCMQVCGLIECLLVPCSVAFGPLEQ